MDPIEKHRGEMDDYMSAHAELMGVIKGESQEGIPTTWLNVMQHSYLERMAGTPEGSYAADPEPVYIAAQKAAGVTLMDQFIPTNPLTIGDLGYEAKDKAATATTGAERIVRDGMEIDSPEAAVGHMERFVFPSIEKAIEDFDAERHVEGILAWELSIQERIGPTMLKTGYGFVPFPSLMYYQYGYEHYFSAYALYPEVMERHFKLQADLCLMKNEAAALIYKEGLLPPLYRLDHDMADSRGTLVSMDSLERIWFPHFARCIKPLVDTGLKLIWHCDGNLSEMAPRLIDAGVKGFQGFQYEDGMDYVEICKMKDKDGEGLFIWAGSSVTVTLPFGTRAQVRDELRFLVEHGPKTGLVLGASSSIVPGVPWGNMEELLQGLAHYRMHGRKGL